MHSTDPATARDRRRQRRNRRSLPLALATVLAVGAALLPALPATAAEAPVDGKSAASAAASCWEIKQRNPSSASGVYWLVTPQMTAPEQFYCDQVTDGGGWVLVGRGRNDWKEYYQGVGTPKDVASTVTGSAAFAPKQLSSKTVDALLNGQRPDALTDGVRLRRARDTGGTSWQEGRVKLTRKPHWNWTFGSRTPVSSFSFSTSTSTVSGTTGTTSDIGTNTGYGRMRFADVTETNWQRGFRYGDTVTGSSSSTSHLWTPVSGGKGAIPFTQVYLRPKLTQTVFQGKAIPDAGTPAIAQRALPNSGAEATTWGAVERADGQDGEMNTEVQALEQIGSTVFTGGNFKAVQRDAAGTGRIAQSYLAAFDVNTGQLRTDFRPVFNGQVKALAELPNNRLAVGGRFSTVNGVRSPGFVVLDATTGQVDTAWNVKVENLLSNGVLQVRALSVQGDWLYLGGAFTHLSGGSEPNRVYARSGARIKISTRTPDAAWNPEFNGTVASIDASSRGDRLYAAGYFTQSRTASAFRLAAVQTSAGAALASPAWTWKSSEYNLDMNNPGERGFQLAVREQGGTVWAGGAQHSMFGFNRSTFARTSTNLMTYGGDVQAITSTPDTVFGGCHCWHWNNVDTPVWDARNETKPVTVADRINAIGAWDAASGKYLPEFNPEMKGRGGWGVWATLVDSRGFLWVGGDINRSVTKGNNAQWSGGFLRFAPRDAAAPAAPSNLRVTTGTTTDALAWTASTEAGAKYQVLRNDRPIATVTGTTTQVPHLDGARYAVRAADAAGNVSASTKVVTGSATPAASAPALVASGSVWSYRHEDTAPPANWAAPDFDAAAWKKGSAVLGWGTEVATELPLGTRRPLQTQYRKEFTVQDPAALGDLELTTRADDGIVVYVNGKEVARSNMPDGTVGWTTYALSARRTGTALAAPVTTTIPASALKAGANTVAVGVHVNYRATADSSFDLELTKAAG